MRCTARSLLAAGVYVAGVLIFCMAIAKKAIKPRESTKAAICKSAMALPTVNNIRAIKYKMINFFNYNLKLMVANLEH